MGCGASSETISLSPSSKEADDPLNIIQYPHQESSIAETKYELLHEETTYDEQQTTPRTVEKKDLTKEHHQYHHRVFDNPVYIQKIVPFATSSLKSPAIFSAVSLSWQETMYEYYGTNHCWKAFWESTNKNRELVMEIIGKGYFRQNILTSIFSLFPNHKSRLLLRGGPRFPFWKGSLLMSVCGRASTKVSDIEKLFRLFVKVGGVDFIRQELERTDSKSRSAICHAIHREASADVVKFLFDTFKEQVGGVFLKIHLEGKCAKSNLRADSHWETPLESALLRKTPDLACLLLNTYRELGGLQYARDQIRQCSLESIGNSIVHKNPSFGALKQIFSIVRQVSGDEGLKQLLLSVAKLDTLHEKMLLTDVLHLRCLVPKTELTAAEKLERVEFLAETIESLGEDFFASQFSSYRMNQISKNPFLSVCSVNPTSLDLLLHFLNVHRRAGGDDQLKRLMILGENSPIVPPFVLAVKNLPKENDGSNNKNCRAIRFLASLLVKCGLFNRQYELLSEEEKKKLSGVYGVDASYASSKNELFEEWYENKKK